MFAGILTAISSNAALGWLARRIPDWGGWLLGIIGGGLTLFMNLDPVTQMTITRVFQGNWQEISLGSLVGIAMLAFSQWRSWRATVNPHVVGGGEVIELTEEEARQKVYEATGRYPTNPVHRKG